MGMNRQSLAARASAEDELRTSEGKLSLDAERAQPSFGDGRAGRALALTALIPDPLFKHWAQGYEAYLDPVPFQPLPSQVASIARALAAKISS